MFKHFLEQDLKKAVATLGFRPDDIVISIPENSNFGDYTSNIALQLSKQKGSKSYQNPREIANDLIQKLNHPGYLERIELAGAGFLNFFIKDANLLKLLDEKIDKPKKSD